MRAYFLGIAGAGMSALASVLASDGAEVSGSDEGVFPPISTYLERQKIPFHDGFDAAKVPEGVDVAIVGTSAKLGLGENPELDELIRRGVPRYSFAEYLGRHTQGRENVVITGSFGKSTLTAMCASFLVHAGKDPGYFIGAIPLDLEATGASGGDPAFLIEGDEYIVSATDRRSKFLLYHPSHLMISSLVHDHLNVFPTLESYEAPFRELIELLPAGGKLVCAEAHPALHRLTQGRDVVWYGLKPGCDYFAEDIQIGETTRFDLRTPEGARLALSTQLLGLHNIENIVGASALLLELGLIEPEALEEVAPRFRGVARRLDKKTAPRARRPTKASARPTRKPVRRSRPCSCTSPPGRWWWCSSPTPSAGATVKVSAGTTPCSTAWIVCSCCRRRAMAPPATTSSARTRSPAASAPPA